MTRNEFIKIATQVKNDTRLPWEALAVAVQHLSDTVKYYENPIIDEYETNFLQPFKAKLAELDELETKLETELETEFNDISAAALKDIKDMRSKREKLNNRNNELKQKHAKMLNYIRQIQKQNNKGGAPKLTIEHKKAVIERYDLLMRNNNMTHEEALKQLEIKERTLTNYKNDIKSTMQ